MDNIDTEVDNSLLDGLKLWRGYVCSVNEYVSDTPYTTNNYRSVLSFLERSLNTDYLREKSNNGSVPFFTKEDAIYMSVFHDAKNLTNNNNNFNVIMYIHKLADGAFFSDYLECDVWYGYKLYPNYVELSMSTLQRKYNKLLTIGGKVLKKFTSTMPFINVVV